MDLRDFSRLFKEMVFNYYKPDSKKRTNIGLGSYSEVNSHARELSEDYRWILVRKIVPKDYRRLFGVSRFDRISLGAFKEGVERSRESCRDK